MAVITAIVRQERRPRANIFLDGDFAVALSLELVARRGLRTGTSLSAAEVETLRAEDLRQTIQESAWRLLSYRTRSRQELRRRLLQKGYPAPAVDAVLDRLTSFGHLDDDEFARSWVEMRQAGAGARGRASLRHELRAKGISGDVTEAALAGVDEAAAAYQAGEKRARTLDAADYPDFRHRLSGFLVRRGFGYDAVKTAVQALWEERGGITPDDDEFLAGGIGVP